MQCSRLSGGSLAFSVTLQVCAAAALPTAHSSMAYVQRACTSRKEARLADAIDELASALALDEANGEAYARLTAARSAHRCHTPLLVGPPTECRT